MEWISVEERQPPKPTGHHEHEEYLCLLQDSKGKSFCLVMSWYGGDYWWFGSMEYKNVTHWMPLPEAPK